MRHASFTFITHIIRYKKEYLQHNHYIDCVNHDDKYSVLGLLVTQKIYGKRHGMLPQ